MFTVDDYGSYAGNNERKLVGRYGDGFEVFGEDGKGERVRVN